MDFKLVYNNDLIDNLSKFQVEVREHIRDGWELHGSPFCSSSPTIFYQAMIKDEKAETH